MVFDFNFNLVDMYFETDEILDPDYDFWMLISHWIVAKNLNRKATFCIIVQILS